MVSHYHPFLHQAIIAPLVLSLLLTITLVPRGVIVAASAQNGEEARWLVQSTKWATLSWIENTDEGERDLKSLVTSIAEFEGRIFLYLMEEEEQDDDTAFNAALTFSEAQVDTSQYFGAKCGPDGVLDPQDPRCAKLTITGVISPCETTTKQLALDTLFTTHPQMAHWPEGHGFVPHEMKINEKNGLWMIANFGGGGFFDAADYNGVGVEPVHHAAQGFTPGRIRRYLEDGGDPEELWDVNEVEGDGDGGHRDWGEGHDRGEHRHDHGEGHDHGEHDHGGHDHGGHDHGKQDHGKQDHGGHDHGGHDHGEHQAEVRTITPLPLLPRPKFGSDAAGHARWIVAKSLWTTVSTISSTANEADDWPFGNIRSVADGECFLDSTGLPYFYLPAPDPSAIDIEANDKIALSFAEASLAERLGDGGSACGGKDAEDPTCAKLTLIGRARALEGDARVESARRAFGAQHPRAEWLARGGAHTGGNFYTLEVTEITFLRSYGGYANLTPEAYLSWQPDLGKLPGEVQCGAEGPLGISRGDYSLQHRIFASAANSFVVLVLVATLIAAVVVGLSKRMGGTMGVGLNSNRRGYTEASNVEEDTSEVEEGRNIT